MKKGLFLLALLAAVPARAAQIVNVDYIVKYVKQKHDIDVPHNAEQIRWAANMEYLLGVVDWVNKQNGYDTAYGKDPKYATRIAVDTIAANKAIEELIKPAGTVPGCNSGATFCIRPYGGNSFKFTISAKGTFTINWGDGTTETFTRDNTTATIYSHDYAQSANNYWIGLSGTATGYNTNNNWAAIAFEFGNANSAISEIRGCLSCVFPYISSASGQYPSFYYTFYNQQHITEIPETLFENITIGAPHMFDTTFYGVKSLETVPAKLFSRITTGAPYLFSDTFANSDISTVPEDLFAGITKGDDYMFHRTFTYCKSLETVPAKLFSRITSGGKHMFRGTFDSSGISTVPEDLFAGITKGDDYMFSDTFQCVPLTTFPEKLFSRITTGGKNMFEYTFRRSTCGVWGGLTSIPAGAFAGLTTGAQAMFLETFYNNQSLTSLPDNLFPNLTTGAISMFHGTFTSSGLRTVGNILPKLTAGKSYPTDMFSGTFINSKYLTNTLKVGPNQLELWEMWPSIGSYQYTFACTQKGNDLFYNNKYATLWTYDPDFCEGF